MSESPENMAPGTKCMEKLEKLLRNQVRRLPEEDCVEYLAALEVHLHLLWQGQDEEAGHWHLEVSVFFTLFVFTFKFAGAATRTA
jgi:hypothetical protein